MKSNWIICCAVLFLCCAFGCCKKNSTPDPGREGPKRVFLLYADGYNNLPIYMDQNISTLSRHVPDEGKTNYRVLVYTHFPYEAYNYSTPTKSYLFEIFKDEFGRITRDTLCTYPEDMISSSAAGIRNVLNDVKKLFPGHQYGMVYSSHGTGWLPEEYYDNYQDSWSFAASGKKRDPHSDLFSLPQTKSMGCQAYYSSGHVLHTHEVELQDLASAFPYKLDYLILDACLMGCIETAYEIRDCATSIVFSQTEVLVSGFNYDTMLNHILYYTGDSPDLTSFCKDMGDICDSYTISNIDCSQMEGFASVCKSLFEKYRKEIANVSPGKVQGFFRFGKHFFYDLRDMLCSAGISADDMATFDLSLSNCVKCCYFSEDFLGTEINTDCGFSTYLPANGNAELDTFYKGLAWNKATSFVK